jgi:hypothetical protein
MVNTTMHDRIVNVSDQTIRDECEMAGLANPIITRTADDVTIETPNLHLTVTMKTPATIDHLTAAISVLKTMALKAS